MSSLPTDVKTSLAVSRAEQWTLHHVLLHRIEQEASETRVDPPSVIVFHAFATLDAGGTAFTDAELEAMQSVLADYHHSSGWWECERAVLEDLLYHITQARGTNHRLQSA